MSYGITHRHPYLVFYELFYPSTDDPIDFHLIAPEEETNLRFPARPSET